MREQPAANHSAAHPQPAPDLPSLIEQTRSGDLDSFAELVRRFQHMAHGYAYSVLGDFHWAEDAAQEAFVEAYLHMADLRHPEAFPGWLRRIVYKHCDRLRRKPRVAEVPLDEARTLPAPVHAGMHDPVQALEQQEMRDRVMQAVRALPAPQREATMLFYINGYSQNEIAEFLEVPVTTVQKRLHDSRKKLKERMVDMVENTLKSNTPDERFTEKVVEEAFEQLIRIKSPTPRTPMSLSPDGRLLAISVRDIQSRQSRMDVETQKTPEGVSFELIGSQVIIVDTKTGKSTSPFPEGNTSWAGQWSPDGKHLAAYVQHEGPVCLGIYDKDAKEYFFVREAPIIADFGFYPPQWTPDSKKVVVTLAAKGKNTASRRVQPTESVDRREDVSNIRVMSFDPDHADESNQAETEERLRKRGDMMDFGVFDVESKKIKRISQGHCICTWRLSPAGSHVAFHRLSNMYKANVLALFDVVVVDVDSKKEVTVAPGINRGFGELNWSPDGKRIAYVHTNEKGFTDVYVVPADGSSEPVRVSPENEMLICNMQETPKWSPDGRFVYCMGWGHVIRYASDGTPENRRVYSDIVRWVQPPMLPTFWSPDGKNLVALVSDKDTRKSGFVLLDLETTKRTAFTDFEDKKIPAPVMGIFGWEALPGKSDFYIWATSSDFATGIWNVRISQSSAKHVYGLNPSSAKPPKPAVKIIQFRAADGSECEAALYLPAKYKEGSKLPMIVHTYGGQIGAARQAATLAGGQMMLFPGSVSLLTN